MANVIFYIICVLIFLRPHYGSLGVSIFGADAIIVLLLTFALCLNLVKAGGKSRSLLASNLVLLTLLALISVVNVCTGVDPSGTLINLLKFVYYSVFFWFTLSVMNRVPDLRVTVFNIWNRTYFVIFSVAIIQLLEPPLLSNIVHIVFGTLKLRSLWTGNARVYSTFFNANWFGVYLVCVTLGWVAFYRLKAISTIQFILRILSVMVLFIIAGSRTAIVGLAVAGVSLLALNLRPTLLLTGSVFGLVAFRFISLMSERVPLLSRTLGRFSVFAVALGRGLVLDDSVTSDRFSLWQDAAQAVSLRPLLGHGSLGELSPHNSYLTLLVIYGAFGLVIIVMFLLSSLIIVLRQSSRKPENRVLDEWVGVFMLSFAAMSFAAEFIFTTQVMLMVLFSLAFWIAWRIRPSAVSGGE